MEIDKMLLKEHSRSQTMRIVKYIGNDSKRFAKLMELMLGKDQLLSQRAAWVMRYSAEANSGFIIPWLKRSLNKVEMPGTHDAVKRNFLALLSEMDIPIGLQGKCVAICYKILGSKQEAIAVKVHSMSVIASICKTHPELKNELILTIQDQMRTGIAALIARGKIVLQELKNI